jgi:hypothetical protein
MPLARRSCLWTERQVPLEHLVASDAADSLNPGLVCLAVAVGSGTKFLKVDEAGAQEGVELHVRRRGSGSGQACDESADGEAGGLLGDEWDGRAVAACLQIGEADGLGEGAAGGSDQGTELLGLLGGKPVDGILVKEAVSGEVGGVQAGACREPLRG